MKFFIAAILGSLLSNAYAGDIFDHNGLTVSYGSKAVVDANRWNKKTVGQLSIYTSKEKIEGKAFEVTIAQDTNGMAEAVKEKIGDREVYYYKDIILKSEKDGMLSKKTYAFSLPYCQHLQQNFKDLDKCKDVLTTPYGVKGLSANEEKIFTDTPEWKNNLKDPDVKAFEGITETLSTCKKLLSYAPAEPKPEYSVQSKSNKTNSAQHK